MFYFIVLSVFVFCLQSSNLISSSLFSFFFLTAVGRPSLSKFHRDRIHRACLHADSDRSFHSLVTLQRLATWVLGPELSIEALAHELTVRRQEFFIIIIIIIIIIMYICILRDFLSIV